MRSRFTIVMTGLGILLSAEPALANQAQIDLQAALDANQQQVAQQNAIQFQQFQQAGAGLSGLQPYCTSYGTCRDPFEHDVPGASLGILSALFGGLGTALQPAPDHGMAPPTSNVRHQRHVRTKRHAAR